MMEPVDRLAPGPYQGSIDYPDGHRLEPLEVRVDSDGNLEVLWLQLPGKPLLINRSVASSTYMVAFEDGTTMHLREQQT